MTSAMIDLALGHPSVRLLATRELAQASSNVYRALLTTKDSEEFSGEDRHPLQYGTDNGPLTVRGTVAKWLTTQYALTSPIDPESLAITCGASLGLANTCLQLTDPLYTRRIFMITPAYFLAAKVFQDAGYLAKMYGIDETRDSFNVQQLQAILEDDHARSDWPDSPVMAGKRYQYIFYAVPTFSNPSGNVWTIDARTELLKLARKYDMLVITDEVYDFLDYADGKKGKVPLPRLVDLDTQTLTDQDDQIWGNTLSNMSFSKYLGPGLRIGTLQGATKRLVAQWSAGGANHSGGAMAQHTSYYVAELIKNGAIHSVLENLRTVFAGRSRAMLEALRAEMPSGTRVHGGRGGYFIWVELPLHCCTKQTAAEMLQLARTKHSVHALSGEACEVPGHERGWGQQCFRLSVSYVEEEVAVQGIQQLGQAIRDCQTS